MAGTLLAVGVMGCAATLTMGLAASGLAAVQSQRAADAADAAALAAADAASGAVSGIPCERARQLAGAGGATLTACALDKLVATVTVSIPAGPLRATASARAGPPPVPPSR
jgi:secretion/DNA translocation related TadE-like protein